MRNYFRIGVSALSSVLLCLPLSAQPFPPQQGTPAGAYNSAVAGATTGIGLGANNFSPTNYAGWHGDTREVLDATWAGGGSNVVTFPGSDGPPAADAGKLCWAMPTGSAQAGPAVAGTLGVTTPLTAATCTAAAIIGSASGNGMFTWGSDDTAAWTAATAALYTQPKCGNLVIPAAHSMIKQGLSYTGTVAADCNVNITGYGYSSVIELEPGFSFSATNNVGCTSLGCFWNTTASSAYFYFTIAGEFQSLSGISTAPATSLFTISAGGYAIGLNLTHWATAATNSPNGINVATGTGPFGIGVAFQDWGNGNFQCSATYCIGENNGGVNVFKVLGGSLAYDYSGTFSDVYVAGGELHGYGTQSVANGGAFSSSSCDLGSTVVFDGAKIGVGTPAAGAIGWQFNNFGSGGQCILDAEGSLFKGSATGSAILSAIAGQGIFIDRGNNTFTGPMNFSGTYINQTALNVAGACTGTATASQTLGLYGTGPNVTATTCTSTTIGSGIVMTKAATIYELLATDTHVGVNASSGAVTVLKNGVAQSMTCTLGTGTACQDGAVAHQISVSPGDLIAIQFTTQAVEVLAGVKASLIID